MKKFTFIVNIDEWECESDGDFTYFYPESRAIPCNITHVINAAVEQYSNGKSVRLVTCSGGVISYCLDAIMDLNEGESYKDISIILKTDGTERTFPVTSDYGIDLDQNGGYWPISILSLG